ncbi:membrane protein [Mycobacterium phage Bernal13]|nr:membrane protein [Mycobacterium phage Bernal13]AIT13456.1 hypothetical protein PBI_RONRAYGUN_43 [Mycobacterium phage RonRayGun]ASJ79123.1 hypothetical protein SEA_ZENTIME222_42 [Mycobacterium phage ZenTime222]QBP28888.1 hypothetical protein SEA_IBRAHIM_43 [Mycobacterium phage Ibrahim]QHB47447.1 hypothetical protein SEA_WHITTY_42 [Mycobacterium phage Whitty]AHY26958.1 hypothetical protein PBI_BERNAL13_43 [Mycobacterium phage Bernal13]
MSKHRTHSTDTQIQRLARLITLAVGIFLGVLAAFYWSRAELPTAGILAAIAATAVVVSELIWYCGSERDAAGGASWAEQIADATRGLELPGEPAELRGRATAGQPAPARYPRGGIVPAVRLDELPHPHWVLDEGSWCLPTDQAVLGLPHPARGAAELAARRAAVADYWQQVAGK